MINRKLNSFKAAALFISLAFLGCKTTAQEPAKKVESQNIEISKNAKWSDKMALTLMKRHPESYMIDNAKAPKWDYVHGLVLYTHSKNCTRKIQILDMLLMPKVIPIF